MQMGMLKVLGVVAGVVCLAFTSLSVKGADLYVVVVGIARYQQIPSLLLPERDARTIAELYKRQTRHVILITGRHATKQRIMQSLHQQFARARKADGVVFVFSGHGYPGGICPYDMTNDTRSGISYAEIQEVLKQTEAQRKMVIADACFSGGFRLDNVRESDPVPDNPEILFFLSSRSGETSIESPFMVNGVFTTYLVRGLRGGADADRNRCITARELFQFVSTRVISKSKGSQHPVMWGNFADDYVVMDWNPRP